MLTLVLTPTHPVPPQQPAKPTFATGNDVVAYMRDLARDADALLPQEAAAKEKKGRKDRRAPKPELPLREALQQSWGGLVRAVENDCDLLN